MKCINHSKNRMENKQNMSQIGTMLEQFQNLIQIKSGRVKLISL